MKTATLLPYFNEALSAVVRSEFTAMFGCNLQAAMLASHLVYWQQIKEEKQPESFGWVYKTAKDLMRDLGLSRRGYEKARRAMMAAGILQYRRGGVHGKMHWRLNVEALLQKVCQINLKAMPDHIPPLGRDQDNFNLPAWVNQALWNRFLVLRGKLSNKQKKSLIRELTLLRDAGVDVDAVMLKTIEKGWKRFVYEDQKEKLTALAAERKRIQDVQAGSRQKDSWMQHDQGGKPPNKDFGTNMAQSIMSLLKTKKW